MDGWEGDNICCGRDVAKLDEQIKELYLSEDPQYTIKEIGEKLGVSKQTVDKRIWRMHKTGELVYKRVIGALRPGQKRRVVRV